MAQLPSRGVLRTADPNAGPQDRSTDLNAGLQERSLVAVAVPADGRMLSGRAITWSTWTNIGGLFMERFAPGSWGDSAPKIVHEHGSDPVIGMKPTAVLRSLQDDGAGMGFEAELLDAPYVEPLMPGLRAGLYGSSFRFRSRDQQINRRPGKSEHNPDGLPEITVRRADVVEISTTTFPAYAGSTASVRSEDITPAPNNREEPSAMGEVAVPDTLEGVRSRMVELNTEFEERSMDEAATAEWAALDAAATTFGAAIAAAQTRKARILELAASEENTEHDRSTPPNIRRPGTPTGEDIYDLSSVRSTFQGPDPEQMQDRAHRALEAATGLNDRSRERVDMLLRQNREAPRLVLLTGSGAYRSAFGKSLFGYPLSVKEQGAMDQVRAMSLTNASGGFAVPFVLDPSIIITGSGSVNPLRQISRVISISADVWKGVSSGGVSVSRDAEAVEVADGAPTLAQPVVDTSKVQGFVPYSIEVGGDWQGFLGEIGGLLSTAKDDEEAAYFYARLAAGTTNTMSSAGAAGATYLSPADIYAVQDALPPRYQDRAAWVANRTRYSKIRQADTAGGSQLWKYMREAVGQGDLLAGSPAYALSTMPSTTATTNVILIYGDFSCFVIADRLGMTVELDPLLHGVNGRPTGQRGIYAYWRNGAEVVNANAFRKLLVL